MDFGMTWMNRLFSIRRSDWKKYLIRWKSTKLKIWMWILFLRWQILSVQYPIIQRITLLFITIIKENAIAMIRYITYSDIIWQDLQRRHLNVTSRRNVFCCFPEHLISECTGMAVSGRETIWHGGPIWRWMWKWCHL